MVIHNGVQYRNKWYVNPGEEPGSSMAWEEVGGTDSSSGANNNWSPRKVYDSAGTVVIHRGVRYRNKWYANPGEEPGVSQVWERQ